MWGGGELEKRRWVEWGEAVKGFWRNRFWDKASFPPPGTVDLAKQKKPHILPHREAGLELRGSGGPGKARLWVEHLRSLWPQTFGQHNRRLSFSMHSFVNQNKLKWTTVQVQPLETLNTCLRWEDRGCVDFYLQVPKTQIGIISPSPSREQFQLLSLSWKNPHDRSSACPPTHKFGFFFFFFFISCSMEALPRASYMTPVSLSSCVCKMGIPIPVFTGL